jgi:hypothetical protein
MGAGYLYSYHQRRRQVKWLPQRVPGAHLLMSDETRAMVVEALNRTQALIGIDGNVIAYVTTLDLDDIQHIKESEVE